MTRRAIRFAFVLAAASACSVSALSGQSSPDKEEARDCKAAERILSKGHPARKESWAYGVMARCPNGAATVATEWMDPPTDADVLHDLVAASISISDRRLI